MRPFGRPPIPRARSNASDPVGITSTFCSGLSPKRIADPLPKLFSTCSRAESKAALRRGSMPSPTGPLLAASRTEAFDAALPAPPFEVVRCAMSISLRCHPYAPYATCINRTEHTNPGANESGQCGRRLPGIHRSAPTPPYCRKEFVGVSNRAAHYVISSCTVDNYTPIGEHLFDITRSACLVSGPASEARCDRSPNAGDRERPYGRTARSIPRAAAPPQTAPAPR